MRAHPSTPLRHPALPLLPLYSPSRTLLPLAPPHAPYSPLFLLNSPLLPLKKKGRKPPRCATPMTSCIYYEVIFVHPAPLAPIVTSLVGILWSLYGGGGGITTGVEMASYSHIWMSPGHFQVVLDVASCYLNLSIVFGTCRGAKITPLFW